MQIEGGCYCGAVRFESGGDPMFKGQCHCRECQHVAGGGPSLVMAMPEADFRYTKAAPKSFTRSDLDAPVTREFCAECGTHITTRVPSMPGAVLLKVGSFDDPALFEGPQMVIFTAEKQAFHTLPEGVPTFEGFPG